MNTSRNDDMMMLSSLNEWELVDLLLFNIKNLWRVDGLYFLGIEEKFGMEAATSIDVNCWEYLAEIEAKYLKKMFSLESNLEGLAKALRYTSWALDHPSKEIEIKDEVLVFRITDCHTQKTRKEKGLPQFSCKSVRFNYLKIFVENFSPNIDVCCKICPPDIHPDNIWCEWHFTIKKQ
ncbi:MAG: hypothetical protein AMQ22_00315 [Candidatus Methanofastidiosum methylothiophilum]|uniref:L-2-amino-thiazoline-4-carboxylic acid hydrolase n=1 Tax=Candidatus Methanofastidiosum methylothiophilum TaxID=1705564 RepID=A0A150J7Z6_9EURY|nr:MAG: hypothetical protein AMQ22_00315 [Candidatus Methanofastidiosum methylthiophilus]